MKLFLLYNPNLTATNNKGQTPLSVAEYSAANAPYNKQIRNNIYQLIKTAVQ